MLGTLNYNACPGSPQCTEQVIFNSMNPTFIQEPKRLVWTGGVFKSVHRSIHTPTELLLRELGVWILFFELQVLFKINNVIYKLIIKIHGRLFTSIPI